MYIYIYMCVFVYLSVPYPHVEDSRPTHVDCTSPIASSSRSIKSGFVPRTNKAVSFFSLSWLGKHREGGWRHDGGLGMDAAPMAKTNIHMLTMPKGTTIYRGNLIPASLLHHLLYKLAPVNLCFFELPKSRLLYFA